MSGPGSLLHVSNLPASASSQQVSDIFAPFGVSNASVKIFDISNKRQVIIINLLIYLYIFYFLIFINLIKGIGAIRYHTTRGGGPRDLT